MNMNVNRCIGLNKYNKKCRVKTKTGTIFCCENHYPINKEIMTDGCFICYEKVTNSYDLLYFKCKHAFHKSCYLEWLEHSTYEKPICLICRENVFENKQLKKQKYYETIKDITPLIKINDELTKCI